MPSAFLVNAALLFAGVIAFVVACVIGTFWQRTRPWRYRFILVPMGFVVAGGIGISAQAHLLRWIQGGHLQHSLAGALFQSATLLIAGCAGGLAGLGLGSSLDRGLERGLERGYPDLSTDLDPDDSNDTLDDYRPTRRRQPPTSDKVVPISNGRRHPGILHQVKAITHSDQAR
ncbi:MAG: hypothetical protein QOJ51_1418 [Acidobacteriaceae bacterium]|nr:hypothetical protein [Acidobacteriaceae bacterium]